MQHIFQHITVKPLKINLPMNCHAIRVLFYFSTQSVLYMHILSTVIFVCYGKCRSPLFLLRCRSKEAKNETWRIITSRHFVDGGLTMAIHNSSGVFKPTDTMRALYQPAYSQCHPRAVDQVLYVFIWHPCSIWSHMTPTQ